MADPISILSAVDLCIKYGTTLYHLCVSFRNATGDMAEKLLRVKNYWMRAEVQLGVVREVADELSEKHHTLVHETIAMLATKLEISVQSLESMVKNNGSGDQELKVRRLKYAFMKEKIDRAIEDLKEWQALFDPSWYLIMKIGRPHVDSGLKSHRKSSEVEYKDPISPAQSIRVALKNNDEQVRPLRFPMEFLNEINPQRIPFCSAKIGRRPGHDQSLIVETVEPLPGANVGDLKRDVRDLARRLSTSNAVEFGLLSCKGYISPRRSESAQPGAYELSIISRVPTSKSKPRTLRDWLVNMRCTESLSDRFNIASEIARAVHSVHLFGFVHKNIRPESILLLGNDDSSIGSAFLIGFDSFRMASGKTLRRGEASWERCLYQHPDRIGTVSSEDYIMQHDIYSLGVCLLELGLWDSFVSYADAEPMSSDWESLSFDRAPILGPSRGFLFQDQLLALARGELRRRMGTKYSDVVVTCLTCLDPGNVDFGEEEDFEDEDGIEVGVRYIEKVCLLDINSYSISLTGRKTKVIMRLNSMCV
ncbi:unnamed protein product [Penicillium salamii]|uniref:Protein kinase domain-containing protein n=1 Tax=Penicillium salamii TaxID=1612424 RepID=A0A9W4JBS9_9EURO|nr:unnamed protein product [Penicillium salamii]CAG8203652.1 unnamed protein product [Penicillium salamii]CAG8204507.1 unnamed protein product [Penicillium salamii]CAG8211868.1 unnamed protein product [Penicillium salamii]CAG8219466.1 unnamed protein product [Penicillium salamii]